MLSKNIENIKYYLNKLEPNRKKHSESVATECRRLAQDLDLDENFAYYMGLFHDIGYIKDKNEHPIEGYKILSDNGLNDFAIISLYHSNSIMLTQNRDFFKKVPFKKELKKYLYIINIADLLVDGKGNVVGSKNRISDIMNRYGADDIRSKMAKIQYKQLQVWKIK